LRPVEICQDRTGWSWKMPKIEWEDVERYGLGTFDLADWAWGTRAEHEEIFWMNEGYLYVPTIAKPFWRLENWLRFLEWSLFFAERRKLHWIVSKLRLMAFKLAWSVHGLGYRLGGLVV
jgi:hypothetical protein